MRNDNAIIKIGMKNIHNAITLIGMPASGSLRSEKFWPKKLGWNFIDLDDLIKEKPEKL